MCPGSVKNVWNGGSTLPFHRTSRRSRRRMVRRSSRGSVEVQNGRSSHTRRSARSRSIGRAVLYCHSVVHVSLSTIERTSLRNDSRGTQFGPWYRASISMCGVPITSAIRPASVVFPAPDTPATTTRRGRYGSGSEWKSTVQMIATGRGRRRRAGFPADVSVRANGDQAAVGQYTRVPAPKTG